jgi:HAD superfamily hydrolase (TIGR01509 family)
VAASQLIIFDCDGVLVDSEPLAALAYERVYEKHGMSGVTADIITQCIGMKQADIIARIKELTGHQFPDHADGDIWSETKALFTEQLTQTRDLAAFLSSLATKRCVASSSSLERIHHKCGKPAPDIFLFAADKMDADPADCAVIEDSPFGIEGAVAAGMTAIGYTGGSHSYPGHGEKLAACGAASICRDWTEVGDQLRKLGFRI